MSAKTGRDSHLFRRHVCLIEPTIRPSKKNSMLKTLFSPNEFCADLRRNRRSGNSVHRVPSPLPSYSPEFSSSSLARTHRELKKQDRFFFPNLNLFSTSRFRSGDSRPRSSQAATSSNRSEEKRRSHHNQIGGEGSRTPVLEAIRTSFYMLSR